MKNSLLGNNNSHSLSTKIRHNPLVNPTHIKLIHLKAKYKFNSSQWLKVYSNQNINKHHQIQQIFRCKAQDSFKILNSILDQDFSLLQVNWILTNKVINILKIKIVLYIAEQFHSTTLCSMEVEIIKVQPQKVYHMTFPCSLQLIQIRAKIFNIKT